MYRKAGKIRGAIFSPFFLRAQIEQEDEKLWTDETF
jgi:hypothetical protein